MPPERLQAVWFCSGAYAPLRLAILIVPACHFGMAEPAPNNPTKASTTLFLSHATEDKDFATPLAEALRVRGFQVWYDEDELKIGQSIFTEINNGLQACDYGITLLSPIYFSKVWTQNELKGLWALETAQRKIILPVWRNVSREEVKQHAAMLLDRYAIQASEGPERVAETIQAMVSTGNSVAAHSPIQMVKARIGQISGDIRSAQNNARLLATAEGAKLVYNSLSTALDTLATHAREISTPEASFELHRVQPRYDLSSTLTAPFHLFFTIRLGNLASNSASHTSLDIAAGQSVFDDWGTPKKPRRIREHHFKPFIMEDLTVRWDSQNEHPILTLFAESIPEYILQIVIFEFDKQKKLWENRIR